LPRKRCIYSSQSLLECVRIFFARLQSNKISTPPSSPCESGIKQVFGTLGPTHRYHMLFPQLFVQFYTRAHGPGVISVWLYFTAHSSCENAAGLFLVETQRMTSLRSLAVSVEQLYGINTNLSWCETRIIKGNLCILKLPPRLSFLYGYALCLDPSWQIAGRGSRPRPSPLQENLVA